MPHPHPIAPLHRYPDPQYFRNLERLGEEAGGSLEIPA